MSEQTPMNEFDPSTLVCVTGAAGSVGSRLVAELTSKGVPVRAVVRKREQAERLPYPGVEAVEADFTEPDTLRGILEGCSIVYNLAAKTSGTSWAGYYTTTVRGTEALVEEARRAGVGRFIQMSSGTVYGFPHAKNVAEDFPWKTSEDPYSWSKQAVERVVWGASRHLEVAVARPADIIGPGQTLWIANLARLVKQGLLQPPMHSGIMNPVYIDDVINGLVLMGRHPSAAGQAFNFVSETPVLMSTHIRALAKIMKRRVVPIPPFVLKTAVTLTEYRARARGIEPFATAKSVDFLFHDVTFSNAKAKRVLAWYPTLDWKEGMRRSARWLREEGIAP
jgi:nucleoside-diphosphate-sugar epimerase